MKIVNATTKMLFNLMTACTILMLTVLVTQKSQAQSDGKIFSNSTNGAAINTLPVNTKAPTCTAPTGKGSLVTSEAMDALRATITEKLKKEDKVTLDLFVMSQCPFGVMAEQSIIPAIKDFGNKVDLHLNFVAQQQMINGKNAISSMHGQTEIDENIRQLIIARDYRSKLSSYLLARAESFNTDNWQAAASKSGIDIAALNNAFARPESQELLRTNIQTAQTLKIEASPRLLIDGVQYAGQLIGPDPSAATG